MSPTKRYAKKYAKARQRRRLQAHERLERDRRQAQRAAEALHHALEDLGLPSSAPPNCWRATSDNDPKLTHAGGGLAINPVAQFIAVCSGDKSVVNIFQITFKSS
jgi:hypothetical protein